jgi:[protein-PII] uridylyltransferase
LNAHGKFLDQTVDWPYLQTVPAELQNGQFSPIVFRQVLDRGTELLRDRFVVDEPIEDLVRDRARLVDIALRAAWVRHTGKYAGDLALIAVGGYGRGELHPSSDIDIMVLLPKSDSADWQPDIERFLTFLWDIGLEVGHSVRSIDDCQSESLADISVATTLFEARLLSGPESLFAGMRRALASDRLWSSQDFFEAKVKEQTERHHRYFDTAYNLEPNVKSSPGGLRDIQTIGWVAKRHFGTDTLDELVAHGFLTREELRKLKAGQSCRWRVRRTADAEVLPHRHGCQPAERNAAAAVSRGHPDAKQRAHSHQCAFPDPQRLPGSDAPRSFRALSIRAARDVRAAAAAPGITWRARRDHPAGRHTRRSDR